MNQKEQYLGIINADCDKALDALLQAGVKYDLIEDCGHYVHCDAPEEFAKIVKEDLASVIQQ
jgi:pimeloyl-ACP methyl ester carboxylesterase